MPKQKFDYTNYLIKGWRTNPSLASMDLLYNPISSSEDERFGLIPIQRVVINRIWVARQAIVVACRGFGKTFTAATLAILKAWLFPGMRVGCLSASFRQAKQIFEEIRSIWDRSPLLQECTERSPIISNDSCRLQFKSVPGHNPSVIMALPLADGSKIRGARFFCIIADEATFIPEVVYQTVIRPFGSTSFEPRKQMRLHKERQRILTSSISEEEKAILLAGIDEQTNANQIIQLCSGYYSFNYVYNLYCKYSNRMHGIQNANDDIIDGYTDNPSDYATFQIPYSALPDKFLSEGGLNDAMRDMSQAAFDMEYRAKWVSDSGGFFSMKDIEACRAENLGLTDLYMRGSGDPAKTYVMTIDPARTSDAFAIMVSELDPEFGMKIVHVEQHFKTPTPQMVQRIFSLSGKFNLLEIAMDRGGGGQTVADYLAHGTVDLSPIFDMEDERYRGMRGRHILKLVDFGTNWIESANHNANFMLERRKVAFPRRPLGGASTDKKLDQLDGQHKILEQLIMQLVSIQVSETRTGKAHFDLPTTGGGFVRHKDLYSVFLIACDRIYNKLQSNLLPSRKIPLVGIITPRGGYGMLY